MEKVRIYLDVCCLNRPFDDQAQDRIHIEAEAVLMILESVQEHKCILIGSKVLDIENHNNPDDERQLEINKCLRLAGVYVDLSNKILERAKELNEFGLKSYDAMHVSCAEFAKADLFLTTDDQLRKKAARIKNLRVKVVNPVEVVSIYL